MKGASGRTSVSTGPTPSTKPGTLWIGTAGFSYPDWNGPVYDRAASRKGMALAALSTWVDLLEVNVSHYRIPAPRTAESWLETTASKPGFRFTAKVWRGYTHGPDHPTKADHAAMRAFLDALAADGRLIALLAQFPPSFRASARTEAYVHRLARHFEGYRLAVEMRDVSWDRDDLRAGLGERGISWVVGDLPRGPRHIPPSDEVVGDLGYLRLHGLSADWDRPGVGRDRRYDYLYDSAQVAELSRRIQRMREKAGQVVVAANNHFSGKALVNALELKAAAEGDRVDVPASLVAAFPRLEAVARQAGV